MRASRAASPQQGKWLRSVVQGYFNYHAVPGNMASLEIVPASGSARC